MYIYIYAYIYINNIIYHGEIKAIMTSIVTFIMTFIMTLTMPFTGATRAGGGHVAPPLRSPRRLGGSRLCEGALAAAKVP